MELNSQVQKDETGAGATATQYLSFKLGEQAHAVDILAVQEIRRYSQPTPLPDVPRHITGVINLRGAVVPIIDLRRRFGLGDAVGRLTVIIVVSVAGRHVGLVADEVTRVLAAPAEGLRPPPHLAQQVDASFVLGLLPEKEALVTVLDVATLVASEIGGAA